MALITCPECGETISDRAIRCPKCGFPIQNDISTASEDAKPMKPSATKSRLIFISAMALIVFGIIVVLSFLSRNLKASNISIQEISISKWRLTDNWDYGNYYEGTVSADEKAPFVAVIGYYESNDYLPQLVYVNEGSGIFKTYESKDVDPSTEYRVVGYMAGHMVSEADVSDILYRDSDYFDYDSLQETSCTVDIEVQLKQKLNGLLFFKLSNDLSNEIDNNCYAAVVDGKLNYSYYISELPYKARGVNVSLVPLFFCKANALTEENCTIKQPFSLVTDKTTYSTFDDYNGTEVLGFDDYKNGFVLYIETLTDGGDKAHRNKAMPKFAYLVDNECTITTNDFVDKDDNFITPIYDIKIRGYIPYFAINQQEVN